MASKRKERLTGTVSVRATAEMLAELDKMAEDFRATTGLAVNRSDVARKILTEALTRVAEKRKAR